jgi:hypothetical protein
MKSSFVITGLIVLAHSSLGGCSSSNTSGGAGSGGSAGQSQDTPATSVAGAGGMSVSGSGGAGAAGSAAGASGVMSTPTGFAGWQAYMDSTPATKGTVERGQYLVDHVLVCGVCHTPSLPSGEPDPMKYLAGSRPYDFTDIDGTVITVNAENLTSHDPEGLHAWSDGQIRTAITKGVDDEHYAIYPIMPYPEYALLVPEDVDSIIQYLRTVPPNDNVVAADFPHPDINPPAPPVEDAKIPHTTLAKDNSEYASAERGRYLASVSCMYCHTVEVSVDGKPQADMPDLTKAFGGGKVYALNKDLPSHTSVNITPDATGIADWSVDDIIATLKSNTAKGVPRPLCNSHPGGPERYGKMIDADLRDIATYIHSLPPVKNGPFTCSAPTDPPATFTQVYDMLFPMTTNARCVACHSMPPNDIANGNLQMGSDKAAAYAALMGHMSTSSRCMNRALVVPNNPDESLLVQKLSATPPCGSRMPLGGNVLSEAQMAMVRGWIAAGAKND